MKQTRKQKIAARRATRRNNAKIEAAKAQHGFKTVRALVATPVLLASLNVSKL